jgi:MFS family permease
VIDARQRQTGFLVAGCMFMEMLDGTIVSTAAPRIGAALHVPAAAIGLVITAYLVTLAVLIPLSGWMVSRFGTRKVFLTAIVIFTVASLLCATSSSLGELVAWRIVQGAGGAMMVPVGRLAVLGTTAKSDLMRMISYIVWPALIAPVIAPLAGGFITTYASWHWLCLINLPLGVIAFAVAVRLVPSLPLGRLPPLDWAGVLLTCLGLGGLTYAASLLSRAAPSWATVVAVGLPAAGLLAAAIRHLPRAPDPLIDLRTLRIPTFRVAVTSGALSYMAIGAVPFLLPLLFENVFGWSAIKSGAVVLFVFVGNIGIKPAASYLLNRFGVPDHPARRQPHPRRLRGRRRSRHQPDPDRGDHRDCGDQRSRPIGRGDLIQHAQLLRRPRNADAARQQPRRHRPAAFHRPRSRRRDHRPAPRRPHRATPARRGNYQDRLHRRVRPDRAPAAGRGPRCRPPAPRRGQCRTDRAGRHRPTGRSKAPVSRTVTAGAGR